MRMRLGHAGSRAAAALAFAAVMLLASPTPSLGLEGSEGEAPAPSESAVLTPEPSTDVTQAVPPAALDEGAQGKEPVPAEPAFEDGDPLDDSSDQGSGSGQVAGTAGDEAGSADTPAQPDEDVVSTGAEGQSGETTDPADGTEQPAEGDGSTDTPAPGDDQGTTSGDQGTTTDDQGGTTDDQGTTTGDQGTTTGDQGTTTGDQGGTSGTEQGEQPKDPVVTPAAPAVQVVKDGLYELTSALGKTLRLEATTSSSGSVVPRTKAATNVSSQRWRIKYVGSGYYTLQNVMTGTYLQAPATVSGKSAALAFGKASSSKRQQWTIKADPKRKGYLLVCSRAHPTMALHIASSSSPNGSSVKLYKANGTAAQSFGALSLKRVIADGFYVITNKKSGLALDVKSGSFKNSANVQQWSSNKTLAQTFKVTYNKSTGYYSVVNVQSGKALDVCDGRSADGTNVQQYRYTGARGQQWCIKKHKDGSLTLLSSIDGRALSIKGSSTEKGANVQTFHSTGSTAQKWTFAAQSTWLPAGTYEIVIDVNTNNVLSMGKSIASGAKGVTAARDDSDTTSRWQLVWVGNGCVRLVNLKSGYALTVGSVKAAKGARVVQKKWTGAAAQKWLPVFRTGGILLKSGLDDRISLEICDGSKSVGAGVRTWTTAGTRPQRFHFVRRRAYELNTPYVIRSVSTRTGVIDIKKGSVAAGAAAQLHTANSTTAQTFVLVDAGGGLVRIRNVKSEKYLARNASGTGISQVASGAGEATKWRVRFDASINALRVESPSKERTLSTSAGLSKSLRTAKVVSGDSTEGFVLGVDANVLVDKKTGKAARNQRVNVAGRGWLWADDTCKLHGKIAIEVPYVNQYDYGAIMGCEGAALYMCLRQAGYCKDVTYKQFLNSMPRSPNGNPNLGFVGSPWRITGNVDGVLPKGAVLWVNKYAKGKDVSGIGAKGLFNNLCNNKPIAVWVTPHFRASSPTRFYGVTVPNSWHCVTLTGYDPKSNKLCIADPASDDHVYWVSWDTFFSKWNMGQNAVTVS